MPGFCVAGGHFRYFLSLRLFLFCLIPKLSFFMLKRKISSMESANNTQWICENPLDRNHCVSIEQFYMKETGGGGCEDVEAYAWGGQSYLMIGRRWEYMQCCQTCNAGEWWEKDTLPQFQARCVNKTTILLLQQSGIKLCTYLVISLWYFRYR